MAQAHEEAEALRMEQPDCLYAREVLSLVRALKRIRKYNDENKYHVNRKGVNHPLAHQAIQDDCNRWIKLLDFVRTKRRD